MWIFLNDAFVSVVEDRADSSRLVVRARKEGDVERFLQGAMAAELRVVQTDHADYRFRAYVPRRVVARVLEAVALSLDYPNFKDSVEDDERHDVYSRVWSVALALDERRAPRRFADATGDLFDHEDEEANEREARKFYESRSD